MNILGISALYHDSAAALIRDGAIVAAAQEERFTRKKHDHDFPVHAVRYCLAEGGVAPDGLDAVAFYDKPILKFARIMETFMAVAPAGLQSFLMATPLWIRHKLWIPWLIDTTLKRIGYRGPKDVFFTEHHEAHAASAFFPSPFRHAAILTMDGVGEWATSSIGRGTGGRIELLKEQRFPHSLGLLYSALTYFCGFRVNSGEYKLMGLAPYGEPRYLDAMREELLDLRDDGSFILNMEYFGYLDRLTMTSGKFESLFGGPRRTPESEITQREMDLARSIQGLTEEIVLRTARHAHRITGEKYLCLAGGVALNCVANGRILREVREFEDIWIQPAAGDAGGSIGAALTVWHAVHGAPREPDGRHDGMQGAFLGPQFDDAEIEAFLAARGYRAERLSKEERAGRIADLIARQKVVGLLQGRMEFGPRALGNRSILGDARSPTMQTDMNLKIKYRESFRPFAPSCLVERVGDYFEMDRPSPYMLLVAPVRQEHRVRHEGGEAASLRTRLREARSDIPAVTHVDFSARVQTVARETNEPFYDILKAFEQRTGCAVVINTSFNVRGEPIVCTPEDAYRCFMRTRMDCLVLGSHLLVKEEQPPWQEARRWQEDYVLD